MDPRLRWAVGAAGLAVCLAAVGAQPAAADEPGFPGITDGAAIGISITGNWYANDGLAEGNLSGYVYNRGAEELTDVVVKGTHCALEFSAEPDSDASPASLGPGESMFYHCDATWQLTDANAGGLIEEPISVTAKSHETTVRDSDLIKLSPAKDEIELWAEPVVHEDVATLGEVVELQTYVSATGATDQNPGSITDVTVTGTACDSAPQLAPEIEPLDPLVPGAWYVCPHRVTAADAQSGKVVNEWDASAKSAIGTISDHSAEYVYVSKPAGETLTGGSLESSLSGVSNSVWRAIEADLEAASAAALASSR